MIRPTILIIQNKKINSMSNSSKLSSYISHSSFRDWKFAQVLFSIRLLRKHTAQHKSYSQYSNCFAFLIIKTTIIIMKQCFSTSCAKTCCIHQWCDSHHEPKNHLCEVVSAISCICSCLSYTHDALLPTQVGCAS